MSQDSRDLRMLVGWPLIPKESQVVRNEMYAHCGYGNRMKCTRWPQVKSDSKDRKKSDSPKVSGQAKEEEVTER